ncbi:helix-turn-helix domain-containing protein [Desulfuromonas acetoxidans]|uniref:helix-turn-helix transcriptional regulator n=1 Tax=Desulfuromonas acetoxidans TaxID=891 RepID=UPI00058EE459|nr:helix-turn-helix domain-containing protein [Desulfuromonas acetoxidans]NVD23689.1 helix-turn-helix domain-containing protein [Desulfuromonas acetoxidans]NVE15926.1 helix-turn-helix domain-containing protein [Desulfuromonas acetoxidans]
MNRQELGLLDVDEVAEMFEIAPQTLKNRMTRGEFPRGIRIGKRAFWTKNQLQEWVDRQFESTVPQRRRPGRPSKG